MAKISLIASDVDGTILQDGAAAPSEQLFSQIRRCKELGIQFVVASGRQYGNLRRMFHDVADDLIFIAENGAVVVRNEQVLFTRGVEKAMGHEILADIESHEELDIMLNCKESCYVRPKTPEYLHHLVYDLGNTTTVVQSFAHVVEPWLKISVWTQKGGAQAAWEKLAPRWKDQLHVVVAGERWVDFGTATKGTALRHLCERFGYRQEEMAAFGDNFNDVHMFRFVGRAYAMQHAAEGVRAEVGFVTPTVEAALDELLH